MKHVLAMLIQRGIDWGGAFNAKFSLLGRVIYGTRYTETLATLIQRGIDWGGAFNTKSSLLGRAFMRSFTVILTLMKLQQKSNNLTWNLVLIRRQRSRQLECRFMPSGLFSLKLIFKCSK